MNAKEKILVVDDEQQIRQLLTDLLEDFDVTSVGSVDDAMEALIADSFDLVLTDIKMPEKSGLELVQDVMRYASNTPVIVMSGHGGKEETMDCLRYGAYDFFEKPWDCDQVLLSVRRALDKSSIQKHKEQLLLQLKVKNDDLAKLNRVLLQEKKR